jgi:hypothetical protein
MAMGALAAARALFGGGGIRGHDQADRGGGSARFVRHVGCPMPRLRS